VYTLGDVTKNFTVNATCDKCGSKVDMFISKKAVLEMECGQCNNAEYIEFEQYSDEFLAMLEGEDDMEEEEELKLGDYYFKGKISTE